MSSGKDREAEIARRLRALKELDEFSEEWRRERGDASDGMRAAEWVRYDRDHRDDDK